MEEGRREERDVQSERSEASPGRGEDENPPEGWQMQLSWRLQGILFR